MSSSESKHQETLKSCGQNLRSGNLSQKEIDQLRAILDGQPQQPKTDAEIWDDAGNKFLGGGIIMFVAAVFFVLLSFFRGK